MMKKDELITTLAEASGETKKSVKNMINVLPEVIKNGVINEDKVSILGFISFEKKHIEERSGVLKTKDGEKPWKKPAMDVINVKLSDTYKVLE